MTRPLILDVDGTLLKSDLTHEMILEAVKRDPLKALRYAQLGLRNKPAMKNEMVARIGDRFAFGDLPLEPKIVALAHAAKSDGREVHLCSGSEASLVEALAADLDFIDGTHGTVTGYNMTSENKADYLEDQFPAGFDYAGNSTQDFAVWKKAHHGYGIRPPNGTAETLSVSGVPVEILEPRRSHWAPLLRTMRPILWPGAMVAALPAAIALVGSGRVAWTLLMLIMMCGALMIAALSIGDDLADIQRDRRRADMRDRPLAAGLLSVPKAVAAMMALIVVSLSIAGVFIGLEALAGLALIIALGFWALRLSGRSAMFTNTLIFGIGLVSLGTLAIL